MVFDSKNFFVVQNCVSGFKLKFHYREMSFFLILTKFQVCKDGTFPAKRGN